MWAIIETKENVVQHCWFTNTRDGAINVAVQLAKEDGTIPEDDFDAEYALRRDLNEHEYYEDGEVRVSIRNACFMDGTIKAS